MKVWTNVEFTGHWPVGVAAVVVAEDEVAAAAALNHELTGRGLPQTADPRHFKLLPTTSAIAVVLCDGEY